MGERDSLGSSRSAVVFLRTDRRLPNDPRPIHYALRESANAFFHHLIAWLNYPEAPTPGSAHRELAVIKFHVLAHALAILFPWGGGRREPLALSPLPLLPLRSWNVVIKPGHSKKNTLQ